MTIYDLSRSIGGQRLAHASPPFRAPCAEYLIPMASSQAELNKASCQPVSQVNLEGDMPALDSRTWTWTVGIAIRTNHWAAGIGSGMQSDACSTGWTDSVTVISEFSKENVGVLDAADLPLLQKGEGDD